MVGVSPYRLSPAMGEAHPKRPSSDMAEPAPETLTEVAEIVRQLIDLVVLEPQEDGGCCTAIWLR